MGETARWANVTGCEGEGREVQRHPPVPGAGMVAKTSKNSRCRHTKNKSEKEGEGGTSRWKRGVEKIRSFQHKTKWREKEKRGRRGRKNSCFKKMGGTAARKSN